MAKGLTEKMKLWCEEFIKDFNATEATIRAEYKVKDRHNAQVVGSENLLKPVIQKYLTELRKKRVENADITWQEVIADLKKVRDYCLQEGKVDVNGAIKALELLGKHLGMFIDKHEHIIKIEEVKSYIHTVMLIMEKHIDNPDIRNRIAKDIAGIGLN